MVLNLDDYVCEYCGKPCKNIVYAAFVGMCRTTDTRLSVAVHLLPGIQSSEEK